MASLDVFGNILPTLQQETWQLGACIKWQDVAIMASIMTKPMLQQVQEDLAESKGQWSVIARDIDPDNFVSFYSWLTKLAQGRIAEPSVNRIQRLYDYYRAREVGERKAA